MKYKITFYKYNRVNLGGVEMSFELSDIFMYFYFVRSYTSIKCMTFKNGLMDGDIHVKYFYKEVEFYSL